MNIPYNRSRDEKITKDKPYVSVGPNRRERREYENNTKSYFRKTKEDKKLRERDNTEQGYVAKSKNNGKTAGVIITQIFQGKKPIFLKLKRVYQMINGKRFTHHLTN